MSSMRQLQQAASFHIVSGRDKKEILGSVNLSSVKLVACVLSLPDHLIYRTPDDEPDLTGLIDFTGLELCLSCTCTLEGFLGRYLSKSF